MNKKIYQIFFMLLFFMGTIWSVAKAMEREEQNISWYESLKNVIGNSKDTIFSYNRLSGVVVITGTALGLIKWFSNNTTINNGKNKLNYRNSSNLIESATAAEKPNANNGYETYNTIKSAALFHISIFYNKLKYGNSFTFHLITKGEKKGAEKSDQPYISKNKDGHIIEICDCKQIPIILGSIIKSKEDLELLKNKFNLTAEDGILIFTLNRQFECNWSGLSDLIRQDQRQDGAYPASKTLKQFLYPTTDYTAPKFIDLLRAVRDLENRDEYAKTHKIAYVHCKAGRGRSAAVIAAYLLHVCHKADIKVSIEQVEDYLKTCRPQVNLNTHHKCSLEQFEKSLINAGSFEALYDKYKTAIEEQDKFLFKF